MISNSLLYREYLNRIIDNIENFDIDRLSSFDLDAMLRKSKDIEDLSFIEVVFKKIDYNYEFIQDNNLIRTKLEIKSKLDPQGKSGILEFFLPEELVELEDKILDNIGDFEAPHSVSLDNINMGDLEEEIGLNKINNYMYELEKLYQSVIIDKNEEIMKLVGNGHQSEEQNKEVLEENKLESEQIEKIVVDNKENEGLDFGEEEGLDFEDVDDSIDYFSSKTMEEIDEIESIRDETEGMLEFEDVESENFSEDLDDLWGEESNIDLDFIGNEEVFNQEELSDRDGVMDNSEGVTVLGVKIEKGKKIVEDRNVTEIDDLLAKAVLLTTSGIIKIPRKATERIQNIDLKGFLNHFVVDEDEVENIVD